MAGMFAPYDPDQQYLLPPSLKDWLPSDHLVYFVSETVDQLDLSSFERAYRQEGSGNVAYHPRLMVKLLVYAYSTGVFSSRGIARQIEENIAFRVLAAENRPSHRTIARFRQEHVERFGEIFVQIVQIARESGLTHLGKVAIDGTKIKANASKHKAMSYARMKEEEKRLREEISTLIASATNADALEDAELGPDFRGDELPAELKRREDRLAVIVAAKKRLEARKREEHDDREAPPRSGAEHERKKAAKPREKDQENFTDPESRIMKTGSGSFEQCYNAQSAVDAKHQVIVAAEVSPSASDAILLVPMADQVTRNMDQKPKCVLADAGYRSEANFARMQERGIEVLVPLGREGKAARPTRNAAPATEEVQRRMRTKRGRRLYAARKHIVEPVMGWVKRCLGFRSFNLRGLAAVRGEWNLVCLALNLRRMNQWIEWR